MEPRAAGKRLSMHLRIPADLTARADAQALEQVLLNLLDNAIKYTPEGGVVELVGERVGDRAHLSVRDTGLGIEAKHLPRLFERFYRVDRGRSREMGGTGLGLSIVRHLVHGDGGGGARGEPAGGGNDLHRGSPGGLAGRSPRPRGRRVTGAGTLLLAMRVAILADIHGNLPACEAVLQDIARNGADVVVAAGDLALRGAHPRETVELLLDRCHVAADGEHRLLHRRELPRRGLPRARALEARPPRAGPATSSAPS